VWQRLVNAWTWALTVLIVLFGFPVVCVLFAFTAPFDRGRYRVGRFFRQMAVTSVRINPLWRFSVSGQAPANPRTPFVAVSNHESYADIFLISHFPWEMKWLAKDTVFRIPVMGWIMRMVADVPVNRGDRDSALQALAACRDRLAKRVTVMIFPEGTRSRGVDLLPFKDGAFRLAIESGTAILPIAVAGTRFAMAKGTFQFRPARAIARVMEPVSTVGLSLQDVPALRERVKGLIDMERRRLQVELGLTPAGLLSSGERESDASSGTSAGAS